jgi:hypothetical protein
MRTINIFYESFTTNQLENIVRDLPKALIHQHSFKSIFDDKIPITKGHQTFLLDVSTVRKTGKQR